MKSQARSLNGSNVYIDVVHQYEHARLVSIAQRGVTEPIQRFR